MKKKLAAVLAGVMVLTMGMATVFAASSPTVSDEGQAAVEDMVSETDTVDAVGTSDASVEVSDDTYVITIDSDDAETLGLVDGETYYIYIDGQVVEATYEDGAFVISTDDIELEDGADYSVELYTVTSEEDSDDDSEEDSEEPSEEGSEDDTTAADTEDDTTAADSEDDSTSSSSSDDTSSTSGTSSPKTGSAAALPILAVAALAGVVVCGKKVKFYE